MSPPSNTDHPGVAAASSGPAVTLTELTGDFPYRIALAGGWIDQPFCSALNPEPPGSMVVVGVETEFRWMERAGIATGTRKVAIDLWGGGVPRGRDPAALVEELYRAENDGKADPSGTQDMIGLLYPGISRLDYDAGHRGGIFPSHIESCTDPEPARWLEQVLHVLPVEPRPPGYNPLGSRNLDPQWIARLGRSGRDCFDAILAMDLTALGESMNLCTRCWEAILPHTLRHPALAIDLMKLWRFYAQDHPGAMFSGCGGGYLFVVSDKPVPGSFKVRVRLS